MKNKHKILYAVFPSIFVIDPEYNKEILYTYFKLIGLTDAEFYIPNIKNKEKLTTNNFVIHKEEVAQQVADEAINFLNNLEE